jgi:hypothetical protein
VLSHGGLKRALILASATWDRRNVLDRAKNRGRHNHHKCKENLKSPEYVGTRHLCQIPVGQWMNAYETLNRLAKWAARAFTPNVSVA